MTQLEPPVARHITGKLPTHSPTVKLASNFHGIDGNTLNTVLKNAGMINESNKPTRLALDSGLIDQCEKTVVWNLSKVTNFLKQAGVTLKRQYANQELPEPPRDGNPVWVNLSVISTYFNVSATSIGKWLDGLGLREKDGLPTKDAKDRGLGDVTEMRAGPKKTRKVPQWELHLILDLLKRAGHPLDFDYAETLKGKGKNSDVAVTNLDDRAKELAKEFIKKFNARDKSIIETMSKTPKPLVKRVESIMGKPDFISSGKYKKRF